jgi:hypothetical protein
MLGRVQELTVAARDAQASLGLLPIQGRHAPADERLEALREARLALDLVAGVAQPFREIGRRA